MKVRNLYALLVGIDEYPAPVPALSGCVNDIRAIKSFLKERATAENFRLNLKVLPNEDAKRQSVIDGFLHHLSQAEQDDVALFYYSGHGSQEPTPPELWDSEPDRLNETIVCYDSRLPGGFDLADKEVQRLLAFVAAKNPHILVVYDCCHSASGTRTAIEFSDAKVRRAVTRRDARPISSFFLPPGQDADLRKPSNPRHVFLSACLESEEAKETSAAGQNRGVFSLTLSEVIANMSHGATYREIYKRVNARVRARAKAQSPCIEATIAEDLDRPFLGGAVQPVSPHYTLSFDTTLGWTMDGGTVHGIPATSASDTTFLAVYPSSLELTDATRLNAKIGEARVKQVLPGKAVVDLILKQGAANPEITYTAVITKLAIAPLRVEIKGDAAAAAQLRDALARAGRGGGGPSLFVEEGTDQIDLRVFAGVDSYSIMRAADQRSLAVEVAHKDSAAAAETVQKLEQIARWIRLLELNNPATRLPSNAVSIHLSLVAEDGKPQPVFDTREICFSYTEQDGKLVEPKVKLRLRNNSSSRLYCMLLDLPETYGVSSQLLPGNGQWLNPSEEAWAQIQGKNEIPVTVPKKLRDQGITEIKDTLKVIACTDSCNATLLDQDDLDVKARTRDSANAITPSNPFESLLHWATTRHYGEDEAGPIADWITTEISTTIVCPKLGISVPATGQVELAPGATLLGHSSLRASVRLGRDAAASRDVAPSTMPPWLIDDPSVVTAFELTAARGGDTGFTTLELEDVEDANLVTPDNPLILKIDRSLAADDTVLPIGLDGKFFVPLGFANRQDASTHIYLENLPQPLVNKRSVKGSIVIFFKKVRSQWLGSRYEYPLLACVEPDENGKPVYMTADEQVKAKVKSAQRIVLYVHGIIGDTQAMAQSAFTRYSGINSGIPLTKDVFDLVMAFDYENLNTTIEQTARDLKKRLESVGLGEGHGKELHIVAHSMGGLVSRWLIEREGGDKLVQQLVMLGTPNGGSPWPTIDSWVKSLLTIGLNSLERVPWPPTVLGTLTRISTRLASATLKGDAKIKVTLGEMTPQSEFLNTLRQSPDPHVRYTSIAGNTTLIPESAEAQQARTNHLKSLLDKVVHTAVSPLFWFEPNDIAASVEAIGAIPSGRVPAALTRQVACDHMSYFQTEAGLRELAGAVRPEILSKSRAVPAPQTLK